MEKDAEFLQSLRAITGDDAAVWDGFDESAWRSHLSDGEGNGEASSAAEAAGADDDQEVGYASDDSAGMIFNLHKLTPAERAACKLSKARQYASGETAFPRELAELEKVKWKETGLALGDVSAEGEIFVPFRLVQHYPDMFIGKANAPRVSTAVTCLFDYRNGCC
jgi:hypothetical protein